MISKSNRRGLFFGWWTVLVTGILSGLGHGFYALGVSALFKPIAAELNFSRATTSVAAGVGRFGGGIEAPFTGWLSDKFGPRWVIFTGVAITAFGLLLMYFINSLWQYYIVWGFIVGTGTNLGLTIAVDKTITNWFIRKRGLAQGIKFAIIGMLGVIILPLVTWQITGYGWRLTCLTWAVITFIAAPFALLFVRQKRPEYYGLLPDGVKFESDPGANTGTMIDRGIEYAFDFHEVEFTLRQAIRTRAYWLITVAFFGQSIIYGGFTIHCIPFLTDIGISPTAAGGMMGLMVFFNIPARLACGLLADRVSKNSLKFLITGSFFLQAVGLGALYFSQSLTTIYLMLVLYGLGSGTITPLYIVIVGRYFGRKAYGSIYGVTGLLRGPLQLAAPVYTGWVYDTTGSYLTAFMVFAAIATFSTIVYCLVQPPKAPEHVGGINQFI